MSGILSIFQAGFIEELNMPSEEIALKVSPVEALTSCGFWLSLGSPTIAECAARAGLGTVVFDCQHGLWTRDGLHAAIGLVSGKSVPVVRVSQNSQSAIGYALDAGAEGVFVPLVETADEAAAAVKWTQYPPHGKRSGGGVRPLWEFGRYLDWSRKGLFVGLMIETRQGVERLEEILDVPGIDMILIGSGDLALSYLGSSEESYSAVYDTIHAILRTCNAAGVPCGCFTNRQEDREDFLRAGGSFVVVGDDISIVYDGISDARELSEKLDYSVEHPN